MPVFDTVSVARPAVKPAPVPVIFVPTSADGVHRAGVTKVGLVANTNAPLPVSSLITQASCDDVVAANCERGLVVSASPPQEILAHVQSSLRNLPVLVPLGTYPCFVVEKSFVVLSANTCIASVTTPFAIVVAKDPVPEPVTLPVRVIIWSPVLVPLEVPEKVPL